MERRPVLECLSRWTPGACRSVPSGMRGVRCVRRVLEMCPEGASAASCYELCVLWLAAVATSRGVQRDVPFGRSSGEIVDDDIVRRTASGPSALLPFVLKRYPTGMRKRSDALSGSSTRWLRAARSAGSNSMRMGVQESRIRAGVRLFPPSVRRISS